jgi:hypothetical protein
VFATSAQKRQDGELGVWLHTTAHATASQRQLFAAIRQLLVEAVGARLVRDDVPADELASYCVHAVGSAAAFETQASVKRLVSVTIDGIRRSRHGARDKR